MTTPILPKNSKGPLQVLVLGRISTEHQDIENIEASYEDSQRRLQAMYSGPIYFKQLGERGSGWNLKRASILEAEDEIRTGRWDLMIMEDLGRAYRNPAFQYRLAHICVDNQTRLICFGDGLDTASDSWEAILGAAVLRHGMQVPETRHRVRRTATHAFHTGGMVISLCFGYRKLTKEEAASGKYGPMGLKMMKLSNYTPIILEIRHRILRRDSFASIADWLNDDCVPTGPRSKSKRWTGQMVADLMRNPLLQGIRRFRVVMHQLVYETGTHRRDRNPKPEIEVIPELAHLTPQEQAEVVAAMDAYSPPREKQNSLKNRPRKDSFWPGQHLKCAICGGVCYWGVNGKLRCCNARPGVATCWNQTLVDAEQMRKKVLPAMIAALREHPELLESVLEAVHAEFAFRTTRNSRRVEDLERQVRDLVRRQQRVTELLIEAEESEGLLHQLKTTESTLREARKTLSQLREQRQVEQPYSSLADIEGHLDEITLELSRTSFEFGRLMRRTFESIVLVPVQALDTPQVHPRIKMTLPPRPGESQSQMLVIDAFQSPLQITHAAAVSRLREAHPKQSIRWLSQELKLNWEVVDRAVKYAQLMSARGTADPFVELTTRPAKASRWRKQSLAKNVDSHSMPERDEGGAESDIPRPGEMPPGAAA